MRVNHRHHSSDNAGDNDVVHDVDNSDHVDASGGHDRNHLCHGNKTDDGDSLTGR